MKQPTVPARTLPRPVTLGEAVAVLSDHGLLDGMEETTRAVQPAEQITALEQHSDSVCPGDLFVAWKGTTFDAHGVLADVAARGAVASVVERFAEPADFPQIRVREGRQAAARLAQALYGEPSRAVRVTAITGTNGKTTTAHMVRWLEAARGPAASLGTLGLVDPQGQVRPGTEGLTTPGPIELARWMAELERSDVEALVLEASSHALHQHRLDGVQVRTAIFTNLTRDHLDYHGTEDAYRTAKRGLADLLSPEGVLVRSGDDPAWTGLSGPGGTVTFSVRSDGHADVVASDIRTQPDRTSFVLRWRGEAADVELPLVGSFNVENALGAAGGFLARGAAPADVADRLSRTPQVAGRMERVDVDAPFTVLIDFAHTPDALRRMLDVLRPLTAGRLIVVFGAGGDRDAGKRPRMGGAVAQGADLAVVTSDNPRTEDPDAIIDDVVAGMEGTQYQREADRVRAIGRALDQARAGDVVVLAGKGHERTQTVGTEVRPFDERAVVHAWAGGGAG